MSRNKEFVYWNTFQDSIRTEEVLSYLEGFHGKIILYLRRLQGGCQGVFGNKIQVLQYTWGGIEFPKFL